MKDTLLFWLLMLALSTGFITLCWYRPVWAVAGLALCVVLVGVWVLWLAGEP